MISILKILTTGISLFVFTFILAACTANNPPSDLEEETIVPSAEVEPVEQSSSGLYTTWTWLSTNTEKPETIEPKTPGQFGITFNTDNTVNVSTDCNTASGTFTLQEGTPAITFSTFAMTRKLCQGSQETVFLNQLKNAYSYEITGNEMRLYLSGDNGFMTFTTQ